MTKLEEYSIDSLRTQICRDICHNLVAYQMTTPRAILVKNYEDTHALTSLIEIANTMR